jgi:hypothetical protein
VAPEVARATAAEAAISSPITLVSTAVKTGAYTAASGDNVLTNAATADVPILLPTDPPDKTKIGVHMVGQVGGFRTIISCGGTDVLDVAGGFTTDTLDTLNQSVVYQFQASTKIWNTNNASVDFDAFDSVAFSGNPADLSGGILSIECAAPGTIFKIIRNAADTAWTFLGATITARPSSRTDIYFDAVGGTTGPTFALPGDGWDSA